ncbi:DUF1566 domain-containing protein [Thalassotalea nanhaiensis]|uniref:DUF1566 domain-containing protein n=1 Tax=Thalassotalea nanhaiensis TaxID=3065648 RepID=A0ABY9TEH9_9GAMM|nr:DUF1566 domain-containing protein [Colwelliaceae bacterium SQ345]
MKLINKTLALIFTTVACNGFAAACEPIIENNEQYIVHSDGTVTDTINGLIWMRCRLGESWDGSQCIDEAVAYSWNDALAMSETSTFAGHSDWYLPNIKELFSTVDLSCAFPAVNETLFPKTGIAAFWSSTHNSNDAAEAWTIEFYRGEPVLYGKARQNFVRLARKVSP